MKKLFFLFPIMIFAILTMAQEIQLTFDAGNIENDIDSIIVLNQRSGQTVKLSGSDVLVLNRIPTGSGFIEDISDEGLLFPNPTDGFSYLSYKSAEKGDVELRVYNSSGHLLGNQINFLTPGNHQFKVTFPMAGFYVVSVRRNQEVNNFKAISLGINLQNFQIQYIGNNSDVPKQNMVRKNALVNKSIDYKTGDILHFTLYSGNMITVMTESPVTSRNILVNFYECIDPDNRKYKTVTVGGQTWMAENLAYLPLVKPGSSFSYTEPQYYVYNYEGNNVSEAKMKLNYKKNGVLYNWIAATKDNAKSTNSNQIQGVCPSGWHLPSDEEWKELEIALGMNQNQIDNNGWRGNDQANKLKDIAGWFDNGNGNNMSAFSALPSGFLSTGKTFTKIGYETVWWSSTANNNEAMNRSLINGSQAIGREYKTKSDGYSVRCIKSTTTGKKILNQTTDIEGNSYFILDTLDLSIKFQALDSLSNPLSNISVVCQTLQNFVILYVNQSLREPWFRIYTYDELSELKSAEILKSTNQPTIAVTAIIVKGLAILGIYDFIKEMVTDFPRIDEVQNDGSLVKKCITGDWNDVISTAGLIGAATKGFKAIKVFGAPAKLRGVTAINLGFTYKKLTKETIKEVAIKAASEFGPLDKDRTVICWYEQKGGGIESGVPILYVDDKSDPNILTDTRDNKTYNTIKIGNQEWMAENLAYLPSVSPSSQGSGTAPYYYV